MGIYIETIHVFTHVGMHTHTHKHKHNPSLSEKKVKEVMI